MSFRSKKWSASSTLLLIPHPLLGCFYIHENFPALNLYKQFDHGLFNV